MMRDARDPVMCLHVGLPKAGSTSLQQGLFRHLPQVDYHALARKGGPHAENSAFGDFVRTLREGHGLGADFQSFRDGLRAQNDERPMLISEERFGDHLGMGLHAKAGLLADLFSPARVLVVIRKPAALLPSMFYQERRYARYGLGRRGGVARWVNEALDHPDHYLSPAQMVRFDWVVGAFEATFGADRVTVLPLEWMSAAPDRFAAGMAGFLGLPQDIVAARLAATKRPRNARPGLFSMWGEVMSQGILHAPRHLAAAMSTGRMDARTIRRLTDFTRPGIERLAERHGLPLGDLGYIGAEPSEEPNPARPVLASGGSVQR